MALHEGQYMLGCYLWPHRILDLVDADVEPGDLARTRWEFRTDSRSVYTTADGGLFVEVPDQFPKPDGARSRVSVEPNDPQVQFGHEACDSLNLVLLELALGNVVSEPAAPFHLVPAEVDDAGCIRPLGRGRGAHQSDVRGRSAAGRPALMEPDHRSWRFSVGHEVQTVPDLDSRRSLPNALPLAQVNTLAPALVVSAYHHWFQQRFGEALLSAWMVVEQYLDSLWTRHTASMTAERRNRLKDSRTYSAAVRTEVLQTAGVLEADGAGLFHEARSRRNQMVHAATPVRFEDAQLGIRAMERVLDGASGAGPRPQPLFLQVRW